MSMLKLIKNKIEKDCRKLHPDIFELLFSYQKQIHAKLSNIKGLYFIDHIALILFDPNNEVVIFSSTPSVEYNIIIHDLWKDDIAFNPAAYEDGSMIFWDQNHNNHPTTLKKLKAIDHNFQTGFNLYKKIGDFKFVYSFATRNNITNSKEYYTNLKNELFIVGDYSYRMVNEIYSLHCSQYTPPTITSEPRKKPNLRLIKNDQYV